MFVLDWDGTIVGRVDFQSQLYVLHKSLEKKGIKSLLPKRGPPAFSKDSKLVRPGFAAFVRAMQARYPEVYFFVYTASERNWARAEITWVCEQHEVDIAGVFTRDDCTPDPVQGYTKSLTQVLPRIYKAIDARRRKRATDEYKATGVKRVCRRLTAKDKAVMEQERLVIIDNNAVYRDHQDRLLLCPDYNYAVFENMLDGIPHELQMDPFVQTAIRTMATGGLVCPVPGSGDLMHTRTAQYAWMLAKCKSVHDANRAYEHDDFWVYLRKVITKNKIERFPGGVLRKIQDMLQSRLKRREHSA